MGGCSFATRTVSCGRCRSRRLRRWSSGCTGFLFETLDGTVTGCTSTPAGTRPQSTGIGGAANGSVVFSDTNQGDGGGDGPIWLVSPGGSPIELDSSRDDSKALVAAASQLLSNLTQLAGVVTLPRALTASITQIEFVGLSDNRALVILVFNDREVQNRIIQLERYHSADELRRAALLLLEGS